MRSTAGTAFKASRIGACIGLAFSLAAGIAAAAAPVRPAAEEETASAARGQDLVQRNCGMCHAVGRSDVSASPTAPAFRDLSQRYPIDNLAEALAEGILTGHPQMPEFEFEPDQVSDIILYLKSIQTRQPAMLGPLRKGGARAGGAR